MLSHGLTGDKSRKHGGSWRGLEKCSKEKRAKTTGKNREITGIHILVIACNDEPGKGVKLQINLDQTSFQGKTGLKGGEE